MPSTNKKDRAILNSLVCFAFNLSKDPRTKVGAAVVSSDFEQIQFSYNGFPSGFEDSEENWKPENKSSYVIHAEMNAITRCPFDKKGATLYCTLTPCHPCLNIIAGTGISDLVFIDSRPNNSVEYNNLLKRFNSVRKYEAQEIINLEGITEMLYKGFLG